MLAAVQFDDDQCLQAREVADVEADLMLPPELEACELTTAQTAPKKAFGVSLVRPKASGVSAHADSKA